MYERIVLGCDQGGNITQSHYIMKRKVESKPLGTKGLEISFSSLAPQLPHQLTTLRTCLTYFSSPMHRVINEQRSVYIFRHIYRIVLYSLCDHTSPLPPSTDTPTHPHTHARTHRFCRQPEKISTPDGMKLPFPFTNKAQFLPAGHLLGLGLGG